MVGLGKVGVFAFIFPGEMAFVPDVSEAVAAGYLIGVGFEGEE